MPEKNIGQKYKNHKDAWNSGKAEYQPINYLQDGANQPRHFTGIRHITPVGEPRNSQNFLQPNNPGQYNFPPRFKAPSMFNSHFSSGPKLVDKKEVAQTDSNNQVKNKWKIEVDDLGYGYDSEISSTKKQEKDKQEEEDDYGFNQTISKPSLLGETPVDKLPPPKFNSAEKIKIEENDEKKAEHPKPKWIS